MAATRLFDAHAHLQNCPGGFSAAIRARAAAGITLTLCAGTRPEDWEQVGLLASGGAGVLPCFGLHPWFADGAGPDWLPLLEKFLLAAPSCVGEIGLDKAVDTDFGLQTSVFRGQLRLAVSLARPVVIHCVRAWDVLVDILKEERPHAFMLHAYGGSPEMTAGLARLGGYFSFGGELLRPERAKARRALLAAPAERLLFETEAPSREELPEILRAASAVLGAEPDALSGLSWENARGFLGGLFPRDAEKEVF